MSEQTKPKILSTADAVDYLGGRPKADTLRRWRSEGKGPDYVKLSGSIVGYRREDLDTFIAGKVQRTS